MTGPLSAKRLLQRAQQWLRRSRLEGSPRLLLSARPFALTHSKGPHRPLDRSLLYPLRRSPAARGAEPPGLIRTQLLALSQQLLNGLGKGPLEVEKLRPFGRDADSRHSWV